jgi:membrane-bound lytic murein transglycosylase F
MIRIITRLTRIGRFAALSVVVAALCACAEAEEPPVEHDLAQILARDTLVVLTTYNSTSYFIYRGLPMGFEYELLRAFAREHEVELRLQVVRDRDELLPMLRRGEGDVVAARLTPPADSITGGALYTNALYRTTPVLVQRDPQAEGRGLPQPVDTMVQPRREPVQIRARLITRPGELGGETVHVVDRERYVDRLVELSDSITGDITVVEVESDVQAEALIRRVARGEVELAVTQGNVAALSAEYFENVAVRPTMGPLHDVAWAVRPNAPNLLAALDEWIVREQEGDRFDQLVQKYFVDRAGYRERVASEYLTSETGRLSAFDDLLRRYAAELGWDWRLLASQAYQESEFNPNAVSWAGAVGLMQLMPPTARSVGVTDSRDPEQNVRGAVTFLRDLRSYWTERIRDDDQRLRFILAAYNVGPGHVEDARRLTEKHGGDPDVWEDVAHWLLQKSRREVYTDPVVRYGFARGLEPVTYVEHILERYAHYREFVES